VHTAIVIIGPVLGAVCKKSVSLWRIVGKDSA